MNTSSNEYTKVPFMYMTIPKPKLKRSFNTMPISFLSNKSKQDNNPTPPPFEIKTKTIHDCAKLIVNQQHSHENQSNKNTYPIDL